MSLHDILDYINAAKAVLPANSKATPLLKRLLEDAYRECGSAESRIATLEGDERQHHRVIAEQYDTIKELRDRLDAVNAANAKLVRDIDHIKNPPTKVRVSILPGFTQQPGTSLKINRIKALRTVYVGPDTYYGLAAAKNEVEKMEADPMHAFDFLACTKDLQMLTDAGLAVEKL